MHDRDGVQLDDTVPGVSFPCLCEEHEARKIPALPGSQCWRWAAALLQPFRPASLAGLAAGAPLAQAAGEPSCQAALGEVAGPAAGGTPRQTPSSLAVLEAAVGPAEGPLRRGSVAWAAGEGVPEAPCPLGWRASWAVAAAGVAVPLQGHSDARRCRSGAASHWAAAVRPAAAVAAEVAVHWLQALAGRQQRRCLLPRPALSL